MSRQKQKKTIIVDMFFDENDRTDLLLYTDGSCVRNGTSNSAGGIGIHFPNKELTDISKIFPLENCTNQRTELYAILSALRYVKSHFKLSEYNLHIKTDSEYSINCLTKWVSSWIKNGWIKQNGEPVLNKDLIETIYKYIVKYHIALQHVPAHTGKKDPDSLGNYKADQLATKATQNAIKKQQMKDYKNSKNKSTSQTSKTNKINQPNINFRNKSADNLIIELIKSSK